MRVDFNVPMADGKVTDDKRIKACAANHQICVGTGCFAHPVKSSGTTEGRSGPGIQPEARFGSFSLGFWGFPLRWRPICVGPEVEAMAKELKPGEVLMLENTRFHKGEEKNDLELAKQMASLADVYVNDAFGSAHRAHSSTEGIARFLPAVSGFLMEQELEYLGRAVANPEHPYIAILGGAKISDKILSLRHCSQRPIN